MGAIAHWPFNFVAGATAPDVSSNNHQLTLAGPVYVTGRSNEALAFNGTNQYAYATDAQSGGTSGAGLDMGTRSWTVSLWVKTTRSGMLVTKMGFIGGNNPDAWGVSISGNGTVGLHLGKAGVGQVNIFNGDGRPVNDGEWHHLAVVFNRAGNVTRYVDGAPSGSTSSLAFLAGQSIDNAKQVQIGARDQAGDELFFAGLIDDVRIYPRILVGEEIAALAGLAEPPPPPPWSTPTMLVSSHGRVAVGNRVHVVGHSGGNLVHRSSVDQGFNWTAPATIAAAAGNYPMQYGGLFAAGDTVYLLTAAGDMGSTSQPLDFRKSTNNGGTWSNPVRITRPGQEIRRANIVASGEHVHVFGGQSGAGGYGTGIFYFRSTNGGLAWEPGVRLNANADASARLAVDGATVHVAFGLKLSSNSFGGRTHYLRSTNHGLTWSEPLFIGEKSAQSDVQARQQIAAADGRVFVMWQRERLFAGGTLPADRLGYNYSTDGGLTWVGPRLLPGHTGIDRNHHQIWMVPGGGLHIAWCHGPPSDPASPTGYLFSPNYGASWGQFEIAISTVGGNLPHGVMADSTSVHLVTEPGAGTYARRAALPAAAAFTAIWREMDQVRIQWRGQGTLQSAPEIKGPWEDLSSAANPYSIEPAAGQRFFRILTR